MNQEDGHPNRKGKNMSNSRSLQMLPQEHGTRRSWFSRTSSCLHFILAGEGRDEGEPGWQMRV